MTEIFQNPISLNLNKLSNSAEAGRKKTRGEKMKVSSIMLLKTNASKMSETGLSIILLKNKLLIDVFPLC